MRLHRLALGAVGPFASAYDLDLDAVAAGGLFLLEGPTGAGKSTLLDAVTFALYGAVAGRGASKDRLHTDFATALEPFVELEFSVGAVRHRIRRTPAFSRAKRHGPGTTAVQSTVRLWRIEPDEEVVLSVRVREADDEVRRLLGGLSAEQFRQVVVLPQGEFATFLRADADDRREVLQRLFSTEHYQAIEKTLVELRKDASARVGNADALVRDALAALRQAGGDDTFEVAELLDAADDVRRMRLDLLEDVLREESEQARSAATVAAGRRDTATVARDATIATRRLYEARREAEGARVRLLAGDAEIAELAGRRDAAVQARSLGAVLRELDALERAFAAAEDRVGLLDLRALSPEVAGAVMPSGSASPEALRAEAARSRATALGLQAVRIQEEGLPIRVREADGCRTLLDALVEERGAVSVRVQSGPAGVATLQAELGSTQVAAASRVELAARLESTQARLAHWMELPAARHAVDVAEDALRIVIDREQDAREAHLLAVEERLLGMAAELAASLAAGEPCAVCGSLDHPAPASRRAHAVDAQALDQLEIAAASASVARAAATDRVGQARLALARVTALAGDTDPTGEIAELAEQVSAAEVAVERSRLLSDRLAGAQSDLDHARERLVAIESEVATTQERARALLQALGEATAAVGVARAGSSSVAVRQAELATAADVLDGASDAAGAAQLARDRRDRARALAGAAAREAGFSDAPSARAALLDDTELTALTARVETHRAAWAVVDGALADPEVLGAPLDPPDVVAVEAVLADAVAVHDVARVAAAAARARVRDVRACRVQLAEAENATVAVRAATRSVVRVADAVTGQGTVNPRRMTLSTYVLRERFDAVVAAASRRLEVMSSGRFVLERDEVVSGGKKAGLGLAVLDQWTSTRRDTRTLSGGESFYASLALALGLADTVRDEVGGVELETLFVDEGFGTLDVDTLESVLDVIDALRDGGRVVGIVSHLGDLKDRIPDRIEVRRLPDGSSSVAVRA